MDSVITSLSVFDNTEVIQETKRQLNAQLEAANSEIEAMGTEMTQLKQKKDETLKLLQDKIQSAEESSEKLYKDISSTICNIARSAEIDTMSELDSAKESSLARLHSLHTRFFDSLDSLEEEVTSSFLEEKVKQALKLKISDAKDHINDHLVRFTESIMCEKEILKTKVQEFIHRSLVHVSDVSTTDLSTLKDDVNESIELMEYSTAKFIDKTKDAEAGFLAQSYPQLKDMEKEFHDALYKAKLHSPKAADSLIASA
ncbi:MAG: hypothetical protein L7U87_05145 [Chlamydiales bacterium]|nr:hypothetical protein [Chlamydiales bacterium]